MSRQLLYFTGLDFARVEHEARAELKRLGFLPKQIKRWKITTGMTQQPLASLQDALICIRDSKERVALIIHHPRFHFENPEIIQAVLDAHNAAWRTKSRLILIGTDTEFPPELQPLITTIIRGPRDIGTIIEPVTNPGSLNQLGGFAAFKKWLDLRRGAFTKKARSYGISPLRGILLVGIPGTGKSLAAKALGSFFELPSYRFDIGRIYSEFVGKTEERLRSTLRKAEGLAPCVLWIDELERGLAGHDAPGEVGAGVGPHVMGTILTWLAENTAPVFLVATVNDIRALPMTLYRRGRLSEVWAAGLPDTSARKEIFLIHLQERKRAATNYNVAALVENTQGFTGAEIESVIEDAMFTAFAENREFTTADIQQAINQLVPQSRRNAEETQRLESWMKTNARSVE